MAVESINNLHHTSLIGRKLGRYEVLAKIASGGMATVYVARAQGVAGFERLVAIKVLHANLAHEEDFVRMFLDEARLAARIRHPNVVSTIDISDSLEMGYYIIMDYIEGDHLGKLLSGIVKSGFRFEIPVIARLIIDTLCGLGAAHDLKDDNGNPLHIVHRDISPHNILVGIDGISRLTDFGVAKAENRLSHTRDGQIKGKIGYMAPENASKGDCDARSDLFAVGIILWECLTCKRLFRADTAAKSLHKLLFDPIPPPSSVHEELAPFDDLLGKALARDVSERFQSAEDFIEALEEKSLSYGGIASIRKIGKLVDRFASARLKQNRELIRDTIRSSNSTDPTSNIHLRSSEYSFSNPSLQQISSSFLSHSVESSISSAPPSNSSQNSDIRAQRSANQSGGFSPSQCSGIEISFEPNSAKDSNIEISFEPDSVQEFAYGTCIGSQQRSLSSLSDLLARPVSRRKWVIVLSIGCLLIAVTAIWTLYSERKNRLQVIEFRSSSTLTQPQPVIKGSSTSPTGATKELSSEKKKPQSKQKPQTRSLSKLTKTNAQSMDKENARTQKERKKGKSQRRSSSSQRKPETKSSRKEVNSRRPNTDNPSSLLVDEFPATNPYLSK